MDRSFKFIKKKVFYPRKKLRDSIIFHRRDPFGMNFWLNAERDFLKLTLLCNVTICTTSENGIFQKNSRPLDKVALRNLCEVELGGLSTIFYVAHTRCQVI